MAATIANAVDERDLGIAGAFQQMVQQLGVVIGIQVMQTVSVVREPAVGEVGAYGEAYLVGGGVALLGVVTAAFVRSSRRAEGAPQGALDSTPRRSPASRSELSSPASPASFVGEVIRWLAPGISRPY